VTINYAVAVGIANVRRSPDPASELVTQALMYMPALVGETSGEWTHVTLSDYEGWIRSSELAAPADKDGAALEGTAVAVVSVTHTPLFVAPQGEATVDTVYLSTALPLLSPTEHGTTPSERLQVVLPGKRVAAIARNAVSVRQREQVYLRTPINVVTDHARDFIDVPYLWGGTSWEGIDCSGFVQLCYRMGGYIIPRDADQQHDALACSVTREAIQEGDLIFFGRSAITHVGMALNNKEYIHAEGNRYNRVVINSFDPADVHYNPRLDEIVWAVKRVVV